MSQCTAGARCQTGLAGSKIPANRPEDIVRLVKEGDVEFIHMQQYAMRQSMKMTKCAAWLLWGSPDDA